MGEEGVGAGVEGKDAEEVEAEVEGVAVVEEPEEFDSDTAALEDVPAGCPFVAVAGRWRS